MQFFRVEQMYGGYQDWFRDPMMRIGGCAAAAACDSCIYFALYKGIKGIYPMDIFDLSKKDYIYFSRLMKPYLKPRWRGIDRLEIYMEGLGQYLHDRGNQSIVMEGLSGREDVSFAKRIAREQIDAGMPIPFLMLRHKDPALRDYVWHWFLLTGYEKSEENMLVKAVTYGFSQWLDFDDLWDTGYENKGGMVLYSLNENA